MVQPWSTLVHTLFNSPGSYKVQTSMWSMPAVLLRKNMIYSLCVCLPKELDLVLPKRPGLVFRQHAEVSSFHIDIHGLTEIRRQDSLILLRGVWQNQGSFVLRSWSPSRGLYLGPAALLAQQVCVEVCHLPCSLKGEAPHKLPVAHVVELLPCLLGLAAIFKERHRLVVRCSYIRLNSCITVTLSVNYDES